MIVAWMMHRVTQRPVNVTAAMAKCAALNAVPTMTIAATAIV
jgi:hypothetical protein